MKKKIDIEQVKKDLDNVDVKNKDRIVSFLGLYREGEFIYPSVVARNCKITNDDAIIALSSISVLKKCYLYRCGNCGESYKQFFNDDSEEDIYCENCDSKIDKSNKEVYFKCI